MSQHELENESSSHTEERKRLFIRLPTPDVCSNASDVEMCEITQRCANVLKTIDSDLTDSRASEKKKKNRKSDAMMEC